MFDFDDEMFQRQDYDNVEYVFTPEMREELIKSVNKSMKEIKIEREKERRRKYYQDNKDKILDYYKNNINARISLNLRNRVKSALKNKNVRKTNKTLELVGCTVDELKKHLESTFQDGMTWDNYGKWHIDHIRPCSSFDLTKIEEQKECFNYQNLQALWAEDNLRKSNKYGVSNVKN